jgi:hypothetical protein
MTTISSWLARRRRGTSRSERAVIDGLRILATNRFHGFTELYDIDSSNTDVQLPPAPPSRRGCGRWFHR